MDVSAAAPAEQRMRQGLRVRLLAPLLVGLSVLLAVLIAGVIHAQKQQFRKKVEGSISELSGVFQDELRHDSELMQATLEALSRNRALGDAFQARNRKALITETAPLLQRLRAEFGITQFLLITPDRECVLRAHRPELHGDTIDRYSLLQCARSGEPFSGLELDPNRGLFSLRVLVPWYIEEDLIGYLELGKDIDPVQARMRDELGTDLFLLIEKNRLHRASWEEGMRGFGRTPAWDQHATVVVSDQTLPFVPEAVSSYLNQHEPTAATIIPIHEKHSYFEGRFLAIDDAAGHRVGWIAVLMDFSEYRSSLNQSIWFVTVLCIVLASALGTIFFLISGRIEGVLQANDAQIRLQATALESAATPILITDEDGHVTWNNESYSKLSQYTRRELRGSVPEILHPRFRKSAEIWAEIRAGKSWEGEVAGQRKNGEIYPVQVALTPVPVGEETGTMNYLLVAQDISNHKFAQFELKRAREEAEKASSVKSAFVANIGHELRTPLTGVIGMMDILKETTLDDGQLDCVDTAGRCARSLLYLINDLLDFSKLSAGKLTFESIPFDFESEIETVLRPFQIESDHKGIELLLDIACETPAKLIGDPGRLAQVIRNLVGNAIKFTEQGEVILRVTQESSDAGECVLRFAVADTGIGIHEQSMGHLFEAFSQADTSTSRKYGGTGLGLAICRQLVEGMQGEIQAESREGAGSTFTFTARFGVEAGIPAAPSSPPGRILAVDDHPGALDLLRKTLAAGGHDVDVAPAGPPALMRIREAAAQGRPYDIVVTDLQMPMMSGDQLAKQIGTGQSSGPRVLILAPVGWSPDSPLAPFASTTTKPIGPRHLQTEVAATIRGLRGGNRTLPTGNRLGR